MESNIDQKEPVPSMHPESVPDETSQQPDTAGAEKEEDADDAVHSETEKLSEENMQQDADDAVHKNYKPASGTDTDLSETDPDDLVHGKL
jgi:hypothetical protein